MTSHLSLQLSIFPGISHIWWNTIRTRAINLGSASTNLMICWDKMMRRIVGPLKTQRHFNASQFQSWRKLVVDRAQEGKRQVNPCNRHTWTRIMHPDRKFQSSQDAWTYIRSLLNSALFFSVQVNWKRRWYEIAPLDANVPSVNTDLNTLLMTTKLWGWRSITSRTRRSSPLNLSWTDNTRQSVLLSRMNEREPSACPKISLFIVL